MDVEVNMARKTSSMLALYISTLQMSTLRAGCSKTEFRRNWLTCFPQAVQLTFFCRVSSVRKNKKHVSRCLSSLSLVKRICYDGACTFSRTSLQGESVCDNTWMHGFKLSFSRLIVLLSLSQFTCTEKISLLMGHVSPPPH